MHTYKTRVRAFTLACCFLSGCGGGGGTGTTSGSTGTGTGVASKAVAITSATLLVDAAQDVSDTGGSDLVAARALFRSASYPESNGGLESSAGLLNSIGTTYSRTINAEDSSYLDGAGNFFPANRIQWNLEWIKRYGYNAHVIVGQRQPAFIATPASQWSAEQWALYEDYAIKFVRYVAVQYDNTGFAEALFEVGNEIDITQDVRDLWAVAQPAVPQGAEERWQHYMAVFPVWSRAVARVAAENPGRIIRIAGPALGGQSLFLSNTFWHERFISAVAAAGLRLDVVTHHFYGDLLNGWANVPGSSLRAQLQRIRQSLVANGMGAVPIVITEYGPSEGSDAVFGHINYSHESAAWAAMFVQEALSGTATAGSYLIVRDNFGPNTTGVPTVASLGHIRDGVDYPKPALNTFRMFTMLPGTRKSVRAPAQQPNVRGFAAADAGSAGLIAFNYNYRFNWPSDYTDLTVQETVAPGFVNLGFNGTVSVERYLIDQNTSNIAKYLDAGGAPDYNGSMLTLVERCSATVDSGSLALPARTLGPSAVSLWIVRSGNDAGLQACQ
ncbi:MAG: hypothetical protein ACM3SS_21240 [Rhodospirillaceae bacterium]